MKRLNMFPSPSLDDMSNDRFGNAELISDRLEGPSLNFQPDNLAGLFIRQLGFVMRFSMTAAHSAFKLAVAHVVSCCPGKQMRRPKASRVVAVVANVMPLRDCAIGEPVSYTMNADNSLAVRPHVGVSLMVDAAWPLHAGVVGWLNCKQLLQKIVAANLIAHLGALLGSGCTALAAVARCGALFILASGLAHSQSFPSSIYTPLVAKDNLQTTLAIAMAPGDGVAFVTSSSGWVVNTVAYICDTSTATRCTGTFEVMRVTAVAPNALTVTRGYGGTSAIGHAAGRAVLNAPTAVYNTSVTAETLAIETALGANLSNVYFRSPAVTWNDTVSVGAYQGQIGATTAQQLFQVMQNSTAQFANDGVDGIVTIPSGSTQWEGAGLFGGVQNASTITNGVAGRFYSRANGNGINDANRVKLWGINTLMEDQDYFLPATYSFVELINEWDFNIGNANTTVIAHSIGGNSSAQPSSSLGFVCNRMGASITWNNCFITLDGVGQVGLQLGTLVTGNNTNSQPIYLYSRSAGGTAYLSQIQGDALGNLDLTGITSVNFTAGGVGSVLTIAGSKVSATVPVVLPAYAVGSLPAAASASGGVAVCIACTASSSPCTAGGVNVMARSTGAQWNCGSF